MAKIYLKVKKQRIAYAKKEMFVTRAIHYTTIDKYALAQLMQTDTGLPQGVVLAVWAAIEKQFQQMILNGHSINLEGLGVFAPSVQAHWCIPDEMETKEDYVAAVNDISSRIYRRRIRFIPSPTLKQMCKAVQLEVSEPSENDG